MTALLKMGQHVQTEVRKGNLVSVCFMDIKAGFDTVPHTYLLRKLEMCGYEDSALEWVNSYLSNRTLTVQVEASFSGFWEVIKKCTKILLGLHCEHPHGNLQL